MLIGPDEEGGLSLGLGTQAAPIQRRAASQWVTRYATHIVVLLVVGLLVAFGGLRSMTVQGAFPRSLAVVDSYTGTDHIEGDAANNGKPDHDSLDYQITLPRTDLNGAVIPPSQPAPPNSAAGPETPAQAAEQRALQMTKYVVVAGDTVDSIAEKFKIMPETVMGSNGIFDSEEALAPGNQLMIPPIDGMYYVAAKGDTLDSIAHRFQAEPANIIEYRPNNVGPDGVVQEGQVLVVPGGMMPARETTLDYTVRRGDSLKEIAARFGVDVPTLINSNDIPDPDNLQPGSQLRVLPVPGLEYKVKKGDTILAIADRFGVSPQMILDYSPNQLTVDSKLKIDQVIMVPGGSPPQQVVAAARLAPPAREEPSARGVVRPPERQPVTVPEPPQPKSNAAPKPPPQPRSTPVPQPKPQPTAKPSNSPKVGTGRFTWPVNGTITQYFSSRHNGLDIAIRAGTPIHAADSGKVIWAGWRTDGLGYCVMIDHLNGYTTVYGHMIRQPSVYVGQYVSRGQVIGNVGSTGHSTGPHVHFMVKAGSGTSHNYRNPLAYLGG